MTREAIKRLLVATGVALLLLLLAIGVVLPLHAAPPPEPVHPQETGEVTLEIASTPPTTVTVGQDLTVRATIHNGGLISITDVNLKFILPPKTISGTVQLEQHWDSVEPTEIMTHSVVLHIPEQVPRILQFTAALRYMITNTMAFTASHVQVSVVPAETLSPVATPTLPAVSPFPTSSAVPSIPSPLDMPVPSPSPTKTPTPTPSPPTSTPVLSASPVSTPTFSPPIPTSTPSLIDRAVAILTQNWPTAGLACLTPLLLLGFLLILLALRRKRPAPSPPPTAVPPPSMPSAPYLEAVGIPGGPRRFDLKPEGVTIGRAPALPDVDLAITQDFPSWETVSRHHARIHRQAGRWIVEDLNSMNGIYVNKQRTGRNLLRDGWRLGIGGVELVFHASTGEA